jgi:EAL domain-containing protein (putative c-di-GMP-specific phosphodiesterase class I)
LNGPFTFAVHKLIHIGVVHVIQFLGFANPDEAPFVQHGDAVPHPAGTGHVMGMEALARWSHPQMGMISPLVFTSIAEKTLLINPYTSWLIRRSLSQLAKWRDAGCAVTLCLNFSMKNFQDPALLDEFFKLMKEYDLPPELLEIEITESALSADIAAVADVLRSLQDRRVRLAIDDFGTGLSSLNYLFELPVDVLKIDKIFVQSMIDNSAAEAIVRSAVTLGHELNLKVIAEGVETEEQLILLKKIGCDMGQGYYFARPMPEELATAWLESKHQKSLL